MATLTSELHLAIALAAAGPLLYAATAKLFTPARFAAALQRFGLDFLPPSERSAQRIGLLELAGGGSMVLFPSVLSAVFGGTLYAAFGVVLVRAIRAGASGDCGCFGALEGGIDVRAVLRNVAFGVFCIGLALLRSDQLVGTYDVWVASVTLAGATLGAATIDTVLDVRRGRL